MPEHESDVEKTGSVRAGPASNQYQALIQNIGKLCDYAGSEQMDQINYMRLNIRHDRLMDLWDKLNELHLQLIDGVDDATARARQDQLSDIEDRYMEALAIIRNRLDELRPIAAHSIKGTEDSVSVTGQPPAVGASVPMSVQVKMPLQQHDIKNTWGKFDGTITKWKGFHDRFVAAIHLNNDISSAYKYSYLKMSLVGNAEKEIGDWETDEASYAAAWERLKKMYDRKYVICGEHIRALYELPMLTKPVASAQLQHMASVTHEQIRQLRSQGVPVEQWDMWICHLLHERLDEETGRLWDLARKSETPTALEMLDFLDDHAAASLRSRRPGLTVTVSNERATQPQRNRGNSGSRGRDRGTSASRPPTPSGGAIRKRFRCEMPNCQSDHPLYVCPDFKALNFNARKEFVNQRSLCHNCFKRGHGKENCYQIKCSLPACMRDPSHNSLLCPNKQPVKQVASVQHEEDWGRDGAWALPTATNSDKKKDKKKSKSSI